MKARRWYRWMAACAIIDGCFATFDAVTGAKWQTALTTGVCFIQWGVYKASRRSWEARRDEANRVLKMAMEACPDDLKIEGAFMHLDGDGFNLWVEWHDECWVPTKRRPRNHHTWTDLQ